MLLFAVTATAMRVASRSAFEPGLESTIAGHAGYVQALLLAAALRMGIFMTEQI